MRSRCLELLKVHFGFAGLRPGQDQVLTALEQGRDVLAVMPTGAGKSLCYQLPALASPGLTLVVSPLQALMKDQVEALRRRGIEPVDTLNGLQGPDSQAECLRRLADGELKLLYVAPERFASPQFMRALLRNDLSHVAIDEAHCISAWGHDFRPEYRELAPLLARFPNARRIALTATATPRVRDDITQSLGLRDAARVVTSADRPNLRFEVEFCPSRDKAERIVRLAREIDGPAIVYAGKRADAERLAEALREAGHKAAAYHAGLDPSERHRSQERFLEGKTRIVCATLAFGMGIDKPDVRAVIHHRHPSSLEAYVQESGRAGRDGKPSRCVLLSAEKDASLHRYFIQNAFPTLEEHRRIWSHLRRGISPEEMEGLDEELPINKVKVALRTLESAGYVAKEGWQYRALTPTESRPLDLSGHDALRGRAQELLGHMVEYAQGGPCLRARILRYFGERPEEESCGNCSSCSGDAPVAVVRKRAKRKPKESGPECPECSSPMKRRFSPRGGAFWGCSTYPACRGTVDILDEEPRAWE